MGKASPAELARLEECAGIVDDLAEHILSVLKHGGDVVLGVSGWECERILSAAHRKNGLAVDPWPVSRMTGGGLRSAPYRSPIPRKPGSRWFRDPGMSERISDAADEVAEPRKARKMRMEGGGYP